MIRDFLSAASGIVALVLTLLGCAFVATGLILVFLNQPQPFIFLGIGVGVLLAGLALGAARMKAVKKKAALISQGRRCSGTIQSVEINYRVRVNRRHPSIITYKYRFEGKEYVGSDTVFDFPPDRKPGSVVDILVSPDAPDSSALDPQSLTGGAGKSAAR